MPLPCPGVVSDILDLYFIKKTNDESQSTLKSLKGTAQRFVGNVSSIMRPIVSINDPYAKKIQQAHANFKLEFRSAESVSDWIRIILALAEAAKSVKPETTLSGRSDACDIYHMARTYIIKTITSESDKHFSAYDEELKKLIQQRDKDDQDIKYKRTHNRSIGVPTIKAHLEDILTTLAYLGDEDSIFRAIDRRLFSHLVVLSSNEKVELINLDRDTFEELNDEMPYCLQSKFYKMFYREIFQKINFYSFSDFESKAKLKYQNELAAEKERKEKNDQEEKQRGLEEKQIFNNDQTKSADPISVNSAESEDEFQPVEDESVQPAFSPTSLNQPSTFFQTPDTKVLHKEPETGTKHQLH